MAAPPTLDDGLEKLQNFCRLLGEASIALERDTGAVAEQRSGFQGRETEARERSDGIGERLEAAREELERAREETVAEVDALVGAAEKLSASTAEAEARCDAAEGSFEASIDRSRAELQNEFESLAESGFSRLDGAVDQMEADLARDDDASEEAAEAIETAVAELSRQAEEAGSELGAALHDAAEDLETNQAAALDQDAEGHVRLWSEELPQTVLAECRSVADPLDALYRDWEADIEAEADALREGVSEILQAAGTFLDEDIGEPLSAAVEEVAGEALRALSDEQQRVAPVLEEGEEASEAAAGLVDDLAIAHRVVGEIDRVLETLQE